MPADAFYEHRDALYEQIWNKRLRLKAAAKKLRIAHSSASKYVRRLALLLGDPPPCKCGKAMLHMGRCADLLVRPPCPKCAGRSVKAGRVTHTIFRTQRYVCKGCNYSFVQAPQRPGKPRKEAEDLAA
jgi:hypothetical protein